MRALCGHPTSCSISECAACRLARLTVCAYTCACVCVCAQTTCLMLLSLLRSVGRLGAWGQSLWALGTRPCWEWQVRGCAQSWWCLFVWEQQYNGGH